MVDRSIGSLSDWLLSPALSACYYSRPRDRKADVRKKAAKTCGNMCTLVLHPKVLVPHVPSLLPGIQAGLVESQPEVMPW